MDRLPQTPGLSENLVDPRVCSIGNHWTSPWRQLLCEFGSGSNAIDHGCGANVSGVDALCQEYLPGLSLGIFGLCSYEILGDADARDRFVYGGAT